MAYNGHKYILFLFIVFREKLGLGIRLAEKDLSIWVILTDENMVLTDVIIVLTDKSMVLTGESMVLTDENMVLTDIIMVLTD